MTRRTWIGLVVLAGVAASGGQVQAQYTPRQQASINVAAVYAQDTLRIDMTTFKIVSVRQDGTLVNAEYARTTTYRGRTTVTRYAASFSIAATIPPRGQTTGQLYVSRVSTNPIP